MPDAKSETRTASEMEQLVCGALDHSFIGASHISNYRNVNKPQVMSNILPCHFPNLTVVHDQEKGSCDAFDGAIILAALVSDYKGVSRSMRGYYASHTSCNTL